MSTINEKLGGKVKLIYFTLPGLAGRGGLVRFLMLAHGIEFEDEVVTFPEWPAKKAELVKTGTNPCGSIPVIQVGGKTLYQSVAIMRYLVTVGGVSSQDPYVNWMQDALSDEYQGWRQAWSGALFGPNDTKETKAAEYKDSFDGKRLKVFEDMYSKFVSGDSPYAGGLELPGHGDINVFGQLHDDIVSGFLTAEQLEAYPHVNAVYKAVGALPAVAEWVAAAKAAKAASKST